MNTTLTSPVVSLPEAFKALCRRRRDLSALEATGKTSAGELAAKFNVLADDFDGADHPGIADTLRAKAQRLEARR